MVWLAATPATAAAAEPLASPLDHVGASASGAFGWPGIVWHGGAVAASFAIALSGADHQARLALPRHAGTVSSDIARVSVVAGYVLPPIALVSYGVGWLVGSRPGARLGAAAVQSLAFTLGATFTVKALVGRPFPLHGGDPAAPDRYDHPEYAREIGPPSLTRTAWPSGHTAVVFSLASSLTWASPGRWWVPAISYPLAALVGYGMVAGDHHWLSDVVAGAMVGQAVGQAVGRQFAPSPTEVSWTLVPFGAGVAVAGRW